MSASSKANVNTTSLLANLFYSLLELVLSHPLIFFNFISIFHLNIDFAQKVYSYWNRFQAQLPLSEKASRKTEETQ